jgi:hypothetical protein
MDAGPIWAPEPSHMPTAASKNTLYGAEITQAAVRAVLIVVARFQATQPELWTTAEPT